MKTRVFLTLPARLEGLCLLVLAGFLAWLLAGGDYWMYLNPKFRPLSAACAVVLAGFGLLALVRPQSGTSWLRAGAYLLAIGLVAVSQLGLSRGYDSGSLGTDPPGVDRATEEPAWPSRVTKVGREYLRINLGELYDLATKDLTPNLDRAFAVRGFVYRSQELDAAGEFVLFRVAMYCCFADATSVGFRMRPPAGEPLPEKGKWLTVYGRLASQAGPPDDALKIGDSAFTSVQPDAVLLADLLEPSEPPKAGMGMMYEWRDQEPYAF